MMTKAKLTDLNLKIARLERKEAKRQKRLDRTKAKLQGLRDRGSNGQQKAV